MKIYIYIYIYISIYIYFYCNERFVANCIMSKFLFQRRMPRGRPRRPPPAPPVDEPIPHDSKDHFSPLLWIPHDDHRVSLASREVPDYFFLLFFLRLKFVEFSYFTGFYVAYFFQR